LTGLPTVRELNIEQAKLDKINELLGNGETSKYFRKTKVRDILGIPFCAQCEGIPFYEISKTEHEITIISHYCKSCYQLSLEREREEPELRTREQLAAFYGCTVAPDGHFGGPKRDE